MHAVMQLLMFWSLAFISLCIAITLLNVYSNVIDSDFSLHSLGKEIAIAGTASLVEAASVWAVLSFVPSASRALILPAVVVALIYKISHYEDWSRYDVLLLLLFQVVITCSGVALFTGHFATAIFLIGGVAIFLGIMAAIIRSL